MPLLSKALSSRCLGALPFVLFTSTLGAQEGKPCAGYQLSLNDIVSTGRLEFELPVYAEAEGAVAAIQFVIQSGMEFLPPEDASDLLRGTALEGRAEKVIFTTFDDYVSVGIFADFNEPFEGKTFDMCPRAAIARLKYQDETIDSFLDFSPKKLPFTLVLEAGSPVQYSLFTSPAGEDITAQLDSVLESGLVKVIPPRGGDTGQVTVTLVGGGFQERATVGLLSPVLEEDIRLGVAGQNVNVSPDGRTITATFDLTGQPRGLWDVVVTNPDGTTVILREGFTVEEGKAARYRVRKSGTAAVPGRVIDYFIVLQNTGNIDGTDVLVIEFLESGAFELMSSDPESSVREIGSQGNTWLLTWSLRSVSPGAPVLLRYKARLNPGTPLGTEVVGGPVCAQNSDEWTKCLHDAVQNNEEIAFVCGEICEIARDTCRLARRGGGLVSAAECARRTAECVSCVSAFGDIVIDQAKDALRGGGSAGNGSGGGCGDSGGCGGDSQPAIAPRDPNEKLVVAGRFVQPDQILVYAIHFENIGDIEALDVFIADTLDPDLDPSTLEILRPGGAYDGDSRTVRWELRGVNLPPQEGGNVLLAVKPLPELPTGTEIRNKASIQFEIFEIVETNEVVNIIDSTAPTSAVDDLAETVTDSQFTVSWRGEDVVGEIDFYDVFVSVDGGKFELLVARTVETGTKFTGECGRSYSFFSRATDTAGNTENQGVIADTATTVVCSRQRPGDCNQDQVLDISDAICLFGVLFVGEPVVFPCGDGSPLDGVNRQLLDWQRDEVIDISDGIGILQHLFGGADGHPLGGDCTPIAGCPDRCDK